MNDLNETEKILLTEFKDLVIENRSLNKNNFRLFCFIIILGLLIFLSFAVHEKDIKECNNYYQNQLEYCIAFNDSRTTSYSRTGDSGALWQSMLEKHEDFLEK